MKRFSFRGEREVDSMNLADVLMLLSRGSDDHDSPAVVDRVFECRTCNRKFSSFQALGGHRASHKRPRLADDNHGQGGNAVANGKPRVHECSICGVEFEIGQALGGHMRRHRPAAEGHGHDAAGVAKKKSNEKRAVGLLDLNLPPPDDNLDCRKLGLGLGLELGLGTPMVGFL